MVIINLDYTATVSEQKKDDKPAQEAKDGQNQEHLWMDHCS